MINDYFRSCISGSGPLQAEISFPPINIIRLRPNVIFDLTEDKSVLHLGCTDHLSIIEKKIEKGIYFHRQLNCVAGKCLGIDINNETVQYLERHGVDNIIVADITQPGIKEIANNKWDYLLMAEVLEHINDPVDFLKCIAKEYRNNIMNIIITVPNAFGLIHMNHALINGCESINTDHRYWFTPYTICKIVHEAGLIIDDLIMCLYEMSQSILNEYSSVIKAKPVLLDTIVLTAHWN